MSSWFQWTTEEEEESINFTSAVVLVGHDSEQHSGGMSPPLGEEMDEKMARTLALVIVGVVMFGLLATVWSWGWPKIKALWGYLWPWLLTYVATRSLERFLSAYLMDAIRSWYAAFALIVGWICYFLPDAVC